MSKIDKSYHWLLNFILETGYKYTDPNRKGVERLEIPSYTFRHEFKDGFPAISTKKLHYKNVITELLWFLKGDTNIKYLIDNGCNIWNKDGYNHYVKLCINENWIPYLEYDKWLEEIKKPIGVKNRNAGGNLGPVYGKQWRDFNGVDQIKNLIQGLKDKPLGTEHIVMAWNPADKSLMALPPCHYGFQIVVRPLSEIEQIKILKPNYIPSSTISFGEARLLYSELKDSDVPEYGFELHWNQRSVDTFLGLPYNIASYATLALIIEKITGYKALTIQGDLKKVHLYDNSIDAVKEQLSRDPNKYDNCNLLFKDEFHYITDKELVGEVSINKIIEKMQIDWFKLENYESYPAINVEMLERDE